MLKIEVFVWFTVNCNILETLNLVLTLSLLYPFLAFSEDHRPCFDTNRSVTLLLTAAEALPAWSLCKPYFQDLLLYQ